MTSSNDQDSVVLAALQRCWREGYQQAVDALRSLGKECDGLDIETLAVMLEKMKP